MVANRQIEIFSAGCTVCDEIVARVKAIACPSCDVSILNMRDAEVAKRANALGIRSVPAIVIDGQLAD